MYLTCCLGSSSFGGVAAGGDGRKPGVNVPKADYIKNLGTIYDAASKVWLPILSPRWPTYNLFHRVLVSVRSS